MNPVSISRGHSFKGAASYLMGGSAGNDNERADWTATQNIATDNIFMAARFMAAEAMEAKRKQPKGPVWHASLSWDEAQSPTREHMEQTARELLKRLGMERAQAIIVAHNDTKNAHLHIVANLIDRETGRIFADHTKPDDKTRNCLSNERRKMQAFALDYCREHGIASSPNREKNAAARKAAKKIREHTAAKPERVRPKLDGHKRLTRQEWQALKEALYASQQLEQAGLKRVHGIAWDQARARLDAKQQGERAEWRREHAKQKAVAKELNRPFWREMFKRQKAQLAPSIKGIDGAARRAHFAQTGVGRLASWIGFGPSHEDATAKLAILKMQHVELVARHEVQRKAAIASQNKDTAERTTAALRARKAIIPAPDFVAMKAEQNLDWAQLRERQQAEREAAGIKPRVVADPLPGVVTIKPQPERQGYDMRGEITGITRGAVVAIGREVSDRPPASVSTPSIDRAQLKSEAERHERLREGTTRNEQIERQERRGMFSGRKLEADIIREDARRRERDRLDRLRNKNDRGRER